MSTKLRWYIVQSNFDYETLAIENLLKRIEDAGMNSLFGKILTPVENIDKKDKRKHDQMFPGYILVQMVMNDETWHLVKETPKIINFLGSNRSKPIPISPKEAEKILGEKKEDSNPSVSYGFSKDDKVLISSGPFDGFDGVIISVNESKKVANVNVDILGRTTPADINIDDLKLK